MQTVSSSEVDQAHEEALQMKGYRDCCRDVFELYRSNGTIAWKGIESDLDKLTTVHHARLLAGQR